MNDLNNQENAKEKLSIAAFPNPSQNYFTLNTRSSSDQPIAVTITDITGRLVQRILNMPANQDLHFGNKLPPGVYFLAVTQKDKRERLKFVKQ